MAQKQLSPVLQTRKINSLPEDLRKIADDLLFEKFGADDTVKEVGRKSTSSFPGDFEQSFGDYQVGIDMGYSGSSEIDERFYGVSNITDVGYRRMERGYGRDAIYSRLDISSRQQIVTTPIYSPDFRGLVEALRRLDEQNLPRRDRIFRLHPRFWDALRCDRELGLYLSTNSYAKEYTIMGCRIIVDPTQCNELEVRF